jgi:hypothetical protein
MALSWTLTVLSLTLLLVIVTETLAEDKKAESAWWQHLKPEQQEEILKIYNKCNDKDGKSLCRGIFGPECVQSHYCDFLFRVTETDEFFEFDLLNLETFSSEDDKTFIYTLAFAPFESVEGNVTAKCKSEVTLKDFKFLVYKVEIPRKARSTSSKEPVGWDDDSILADHSKISKKNFAKSCADRLADRNKVINQYKGRTITEYQNAITKISNQYMFILRSDSYQQYTDTEKLVFRDGQQYGYTDKDKVLWTNFENEAVPQAQRKFQGPAPENTASGLLFPTLAFVVSLGLCLIL